MGKARARKFCRDGSGDGRSDWKLLCWSLLSSIDNADVDHWSQRIKAVSLLTRFRSAAAAVLK